MANKDYGNDVIVSHIEDAVMKALIPSRKHYKGQRDDDKYLYCLRYLVDNAFMKLKK